MTKPRISFLGAFALLILFVITAVTAAGPGRETPGHEARIAWWREARFGMFIHWGLYSQLGRGEWVQCGAYAGARG